MKIRIKVILSFILFLSFAAYGDITDNAAGSDHITVRYSTWENSFPMFFRSKNKELDGYLVDIVELLETRTIISFQYVESTESPLKMLQEGAIDMLPLIIRGVNTPDWMYVSEPYLTIKYINVAFKGAPINRSGIRGVLFSENDSYGFVRLCCVKE